MPGTPEVRREHQVKVIPPNLIGPYGLERIPGLPAGLMSLPVTTAIDSARFTAAGVDLQCSTSRPGVAGHSLWVWLIGYEQGNLRGRLYVPPGVPAGDDPGHFTLAIAPGPIPDSAGRPLSSSASPRPKEPAPGFAVLRSPFIGQRRS